MSVLTLHFVAEHRADFTFKVVCRDSIATREAIAKHQNLTKHEKATPSHVVRIEGRKKWIAVMLIVNRKAGRKPRLSDLLSAATFQAVRGSAAI